MSRRKRASPDKSLQLRAELRVEPVQAKVKILAALEASNGNTTRAAVLLGISRRTIERLQDELPELRAEADKFRERRRAGRGIDDPPDELLDVETVAANVLSLGLSLKAFWQEAAGGDQCPMLRKSVETVIARLLKKTFDEPTAPAEGTGS